MMRATYGHTVEIELDLPSNDIPDSLFYPSDPAEAEKLVEVGISPGDRSHVHLPASLRYAADAGRVHHNDPGLIEVDTASANAAEAVKKAGGEVIKIA